MELPAGWKQCDHSEADGIFANGSVYEQWGLDGDTLSVFAKVEGWVTIECHHMYFHGWKFVKKVPFDPCRDHYIFRVRQVFMSPFEELAAKMWPDHMKEGRLVKVSIEYVDETANDVVG